MEEIIYQLKKKTLIPESNKEESEDKLKGEYIKTKIYLSKNQKKEGEEYFKNQINFQKQ